MVGDLVVGTNAKVRTVVIRTSMGGAQNAAPNAASQSVASLHAMVVQDEAPIVVQVVAPGAVNLHAVNQRVASLHAMVVRDEALTVVRVVARGVVNLRVVNLRVASQDATVVLRDVAPKVRRDVVHVVGPVVRRVLNVVQSVADALNVVPFLVLLPARLQVVPHEAQ